MIVTPGTSWKWNSRSGVTPSCAASVVPAARATGAGRNRRSRSPIGDASATIPAVAATDSWNPIDQTSHGSRITSTRTAAGQDRAGRARPADQHARRARSSPSRPRASPTARRRSSRRRTPPCRRQDRTAATGSSRSSEASPRIGASTIATFSPDTTSRWPSPLAWKSRIMPASSCEASPNASPRSSPASSRREQPRDRPADEGSEHLRRTDERARRRPQAFDGVAVQLDDHPLMGERIAEPGIVGPADHALGSDDVPAHPAPRVVVGAQPQGCAQRRGAARPLDPRDVERGVPPERAGLGIGVERTDHRHAARREPSQQRTVEPRPADARPSGADEHETDQHQHGRDERRSADRSRRGDGRDGHVLSLGQSRPVQRVRVRRHAWRREPCAGDGGEPQRHPHPRTGPRWVDLPREQSRPERRRGRRQRPRVHTVAKGRICSSVEGPIPLTSIRSSTAENGPFCVR